MSSRDDTSESGIFTHQSNFSFISFESDVVQDHRALVAELSMHALNDLDEAPSCGPDQDVFAEKTANPTEMISCSSNGFSTCVREHRSLLRRATSTVERARRHDVEECQTQEFRYESPPNRREMKRPAPSYLNNRGNAGGSLPRFTAMKKMPVSSNQAGTFRSSRRPRSPHTSGGGIEFQEGRSLERVSSPVNCPRRHISAAMFPLNNEKRFPSKWEDAEKWIFSRDVGKSVSSPPLMPRRRERSKSCGPLGRPEIGCCSCRPTKPVFEGKKVERLMGPRPLSADLVSSGGGGGGDSYPLPIVIRSVNVHGWLDESSFSEDAKDGLEDASNTISPPFPTRDMGSQISPDHSTDKESPSLSPTTTTSGPPSEGLQSQHPSKLGIDTVSANKRERKMKTVEAQSSAFAETGNFMSKFKREETKIMAWENLQNVNVEAETKKLEMKLEKIKTSSMEKIKNKLRSAQRKAQCMCSSASNIQVLEDDKNDEKDASFRKAYQKGSLTECFTCRYV